MVKAKAERPEPMKTSARLSKQKKTAAIDLGAMHAGGLGEGRTRTERSGVGAASGRKAISRCSEKNRPSPTNRANSCVGRGRAYNLRCETGNAGWVLSRGWPPGVMFPERKRTLVRFSAEAVRPWCSRLMKAPPSFPFSIDPLFDIVASESGERGKGESRKRILKFQTLSRRSG